MRRWCEAGVTSRNGGVEPALEALTRSYTAKNFCSLLLVYQDFTGNKKCVSIFYYLLRWPINIL